MKAATIRKHFAVFIPSHQTKLWVTVLVPLLVTGSTACAQPVITVQPTNFTTVSLGATAGNRVVATGTPPLTYQWWLFGQPVPGQTESVLSLTNVQLSAAGDYTVIVNDPVGSTTSRTVTLRVDPTFTKLTTGPGQSKPVQDNGCSLNWWDYDNDGFVDLFIADGFFDGSSIPAQSRLYHNNRDGTFTPINNVVSTTLGKHVCGAIGDYDNDGDEDLFVATFNGAQEFYRNDGVGNFTRLTQEEVGPVVGDSDVTVEAAWADYDRDGFLDLFRANGYPEPAND
ncbi:hypothetical protein EG834_14415, partial [bacterium]|nr:hypothetical protein [bacterium]